MSSKEYYGVKPGSSKTSKETCLKQKMKAQDEGVKSTSKSELPEFRSSNQLLRAFTIKREQIMRNLERNNTHMDGVKELSSKQNKAPTTTIVDSRAKGLDKQNKGINQPLFKNASQAQCKLSNFAASGQMNLNSNGGLDPKKKKIDTTSMAQPKVPSQNQDPNKFMSASQKKLTSEASMTKNQGSRQIQDLKGHLMTQSKGSLHPKRQPMKKIVIEEAESPMKMKRSLAENDNLRTKKKTIKRVVTEDDDIRESRESATKKTKRTPLCRSMLIEEFLEENEELNDEEEMGNETDSEDEEYVVEQEEDGENSDNVMEGTSKKRTRGRTKCLQIHARKTKDRQEIILVNDGEPIGPDDKTVSDLSYFLGTIARNAVFYPLIYTNFKLLFKDNEGHIWEYVQDKYIISDKGKKAVFSRINDAWRRYKCYIKRMHFLKYSTSKEMLKHRPTSVPEPHFKKLMAYWRSNTIQNISQKNADNKSKQKYMHRMGPINFARIRAKLRAKKDNGEEVTQAEMFIETRQSRNGKEVDEVTQTAIAKLQDSIENSSEAADQAFQSLLGKEKPGRVRCYGRTATPSLLKKNQEIATIKKHYDDELSDVKKRMKAYESILKSVLKQQHPKLSEEAMDNMMGRAMGMTNSATLHSSTSTHVPAKSVHEDHHDEDHPDEDHLEDE